MDSPDTAKVTTTTTTSNIITSDADPAEPAKQLESQSDQPTSPSFFARVSGNDRNGRSFDLQFESRKDFRSHVKENWHIQGRCSFCNDCQYTASQLERYVDQHLRLITKLQVNCDQGHSHESYRAAVSCNTRAKKTPEELEEQRKRQAQVRHERRKRQTSEVAFETGLDDGKLTVEPTFLTQTPQQKRRRQMTTPNSAANFHLNLRPEVILQESSRSSWLPPDSTTTSGFNPTSPSVDSSSKNSPTESILLEQLSAQLLPNLLPGLLPGILAGLLSASSFNPSVTRQLQNLLNLSNTSSASAPTSSSTAAQQETKSLFARFRGLPAPNPFEIHFQSRAEMESFVLVNWLHNDQTGRCDLCKPECEFKAKNVREFVDLHLTNLIQVEMRCDQDHFHPSYWTLHRCNYIMSKPSDLPCECQSRMATNEADGVDGAAKDKQQDNFQDPGSKIRTPTSAQALADAISKRTINQTVTADQTEPDSSMLIADTSILLGPVSEVTEMNSSAFWCE